MSRVILPSSDNLIDLESISSGAMYKVARLVDVPPRMLEDTYKRTEEWADKWGDMLVKYNEFADMMYRKFSAYISRYPYSESDRTSFMKAVRESIQRIDVISMVVKRNEFRKMGLPLPDEVLDLMDEFDNDVGRMSGWPFEELKRAGTVGFKIKFNMDDWRYRERVIQLEEKDPGHLAMLEHNDLNLRFGMWSGTSHFRAERMAIVIMPAFDFSGKEIMIETMKSSCLHEMVHYSQACLNWMVHGVFSVDHEGGPGSPRFDERYHTEEAIGGSAWESNRYHDRTPSELYASLAHRLRDFRRGLDNKGFVHALFVMRDIQDIPTGSHDRNLVIRSFGLHNIDDPNSRKIVVNEIIRTFNEWLGTPRGMEFKKWFKEREKEGEGKP
jgi:hypothetical protein